MNKYDSQGYLVTRHRKRLEANAVNAARAADAKARRDLVAERVANGWTIAEIARAMGLTRQCVWQNWNKIVTDMGWQAV